MPLHGIYPSIAQPTSAAAAEEAGPATLTYHPLEDLFEFEYVFDRTNPSNLTMSGDEIVAIANTGSAGSDGDMAPFASGHGDIGPEIKSAEAASGHLPGAKFYTDASGIRSMHVDFDSDITVRSAVCVWEVDHGLGTTPTTNSPFGIGNQDGNVDAAMLKWSNTTGDPYKWQGGNMRNTNVPLGDSSDDFRGLRILVYSWPGTGNRRLACWDSNTSTTYSSFNSSTKDVDRIIAGMRSQHNNGGSCRSLRGNLWLLGVTSAVLSQSEVNSLGRALCHMFSGNATAQSESDNLPLVWDDTDIDFSTDHDDFSHMPYCYCDVGQSDSNLTTSTDDETFSVASTDTLTIDSSSTLAAGDKIVVSTTGTLPTGLATSTDYFVHSRPTSTTIKLSSSYANVWAGTAISITSGTGSGVHTLSRTLVEKINCDTNAVRHFSPSGSNKLTYVESSGATAGALLGSAASSGSYSWTNASQQDDGSVIIVGRKHASGSSSGRACSIGSASGGDQYIEVGGSSGRVRAKFAGGLVTCASSFSDGELFVAYFTFDSSSGHQLHVYNCSSSVESWTSSSLDTSSAGEKFYERWQELGVQVGSRMEIMEAIFFEQYHNTANINNNCSALASTYGWTHSDLS